MSFLQKLRIPPLNFAYKMTLMAVAASSVAAATLMASFLVLDSMSSRAQLESRLSTLAEVVGENSTAALSFDDPKAAAEVLQALRAEPPIVSACLYDISGNLFAQYRRTVDVEPCPLRPRSSLAVQRGFSSLQRRVTHQGEVQGTLFLRADQIDLERRWDHLVRVAFLLLMLALLVGGISGSLLQREISKPVYALAAAMQEVTQRQDFSKRVSIRGEDEIAQLGSGFNSMLSELEKRDVEKKKVERQLQYQALNDELTGLPNRRLLADRLGHALAVAKRQNRMVALLYIDLDGFKLVNDSLGHSVGDLLLSSVAERLSSRVRKSDTLARLGGDEFSVVLTGLGVASHAGPIAQTLLDVLAAPFLIDNHEITISASIGISIFPDNGSNADDLLQQADSAMYSAKRSGKNRAMYFTEDLGVTVRERLNLENQLRIAIAHGEITLSYQPEFETGSHRLTRFEALARWLHPTLGTISPAKFIPIAEESGLIIPLGAYILERACSDAVQWQKIAAYPIQVAVNVSSLQFARETFVEEVTEVLAHTGLAPRLLQLELTESVMLSGAGSAAEKMQRLRDLGISLAIDDFGTGYSCLSYLPRLPFDALKIDRSFVSDLETRPEIRAMVHSLVVLAHNLGMRVIVEGVETSKQLQVMTEIGSNEIQGFLLGRPTNNPAELVEKTTQRAPMPACEVEKPRVH